jgi:hypothetical protein
MSQLNLGSGTVVVEHDIREGRAPEPGCVLAFADVDGGPLAAVLDDHPDLLALLETLGFPPANEDSPKRAPSP